MIRGMAIIRWITKYYRISWNDLLTCHLINKAVMKQNCIEALNQHAQPLKRKAAPYYYYFFIPSVAVIIIIFNPR